MAKTTRHSNQYDVVVIGSGAGGGTTTRVLAEMGVKVALLEAGPMLDPATEYKEHQWPYDWDHRGAETGGKAYFGNQKPFGFFTTTSGGWQLDGEPYTIGEGSQFQWFRSRIVGGRTNHYGRMSFRLSEIDLTGYDRDGLGLNWPITYNEIAHYYDKAERFIGVTGTVEGIPTAPDGVFQKIPPPKAHEQMTRAAAKKLGIPFIANRRAVITRNHNGRAGCHYCGQCGRGCLTASAYASSQVDVFPAVESGNVTLFTEAMAREVLTDSSGRATGVLYVNRKTQREERVLGRIVVLAAGSCKSARILLNSKSNLFPDGLANNSGHVGRNLMDSVGFSVRGRIPSFEGLTSYNTDGFGSSHLYAPWWDWKNHAQLGFPRGYHIEVSGGFGMPRIGSFHAAGEKYGYGQKMKQRIREEYGSTIRFAGRGEMMPNKNSFCEIDPKVVDKWGIPVLRFHFKWTDHEWAQARHMEETFKDIIGVLGGRITSLGNRWEQQGISVPGTIIHEVGTARMGIDPSSSVVNPHMQAHDVKNLFICDGSVFVTNPDKNPTLTINALAWKAAEFMAEELRKGNV